MVKRLLIMLFFVSSFSSLATAQFKATLTADGSDLVVSVTPYNGDITTDFSQIEFFIRTDDVTTPFTMGAPVVNTTDFPGVPMTTESDVSNAGYRIFNFKYQGAASGTTLTYMDGVEYELARMSLSDGDPNSAVFELISDLTTYTSYINMTSGTGSDLTFAECIIFGTCSSESVFYGGEASGSGFDPTTEATSFPVPLPVELSSFAGWNEDETNKLKWITQSEENSSHFEIQKSTNAENFERIENVAAAGNSASTLSYTFDDKNPFSGTNYYRLKVVDLDGSYEYSKIILINADGKATVKGFPNPFINTISLELASPVSGVVQISVHDVSGKQVLYSEREIENGLSIQYLQLDNLANGIYIAKVLLPDSDEYLSTKIVKNNQ